MRHIVISDCERPEQTAPIARAYGVGLECTTFYDPNFLPEHPGGIEDYLAKHPGEFVQDVLCERWLLTMHPGGWLKRVAECPHG